MRAWRARGSEVGCGRGGRLVVYEYRACDDYARGVKLRCCKFDGETVRYKASCIKYANCSNTQHYEVLSSFPLAK